MINNKKILIISYSFPPNDGIGGRRWAKMAKYLLRENLDIKVLTSKKKTYSKSPWDSDVRELKRDGRIVEIASNYPSILDTYPTKILDKIIYRLALVLTKVKVKGNYYDRSSFWYKTLIPNVIKYIEDGNNIIIATGAPFHYLSDIIKLKYIYPDLKVIVDIRDPWVSGRNYGIASLNNIRLQQEIQIQDFVMNSADLITVPVDSMRSELLRIYRDQNQIFKILPHGYDPEDIPLAKKKINGGEIVKLIYGGNIYDNNDYILTELNASFGTISEEKVLINIYSNSNNKSLAYFKTGNLEKVTTIHNLVTPKQLFEQILKSDYYLILFPPQFKDFLSTKFPEIFALQIPVIYIGEKGAVSDFLVSNRLGIHVNPNNIQVEIPEILNGLKTIDYNFNFNYHSFSIPNISSNLLEMTEILYQ